MIPELGNFALTISMAFAICLSIFPFAGLITRNRTLTAYAWPLTYGMFVFVLISIITLGYSFVTDDFSVAYVAHHSNSQLPWYFKVSAVWGGHEGSLLFWVFTLCTWTVLVALLSKKIEMTFVARVLAILGMIATGFMAFMLTTSNPFVRYLPQFPAEGRDLNPLLQDVGLIIHPPTLYVGYVGFAVAFAFAVAALLSGKIDSAWARWSRPWTIAAWGFLTVGIALGSWWAYYELGWGGWWFWDPVENASFMPWLLGTALIHSLAMTEKRGTFKNWTVLLAIFTFSMSLLGTFLVRSGVVTSVHSFASDPSRGLFILLLLAIAVGSSLTLFALRASEVSGNARFSLVSRETGMLAGNILLVIATLAVMTGTLYPMILDAMSMGKISVGAPFFNLVFIPIMSVLVLVMGFAPYIRWKRSKPGEITALLIPVAGAAMLTVAVIPMIFGLEMQLGVALGLALAGWLIAAGLNDLRKQKAIHPVTGKSTFKFTRSYAGMFFGHMGIAVTIIGITMVSYYETQHDVKMLPGDRAQLSGYEFEFQGTKIVKGENYVADQGQFVVRRNGEQIALLQPERRAYTVQTMGMTELGIDAGITRDLLVALGEPLENNAWAVRIHYKPFVRLIWLGGLIMVFGGICSMLDKRYRQKSPVKRSSTQPEMLSGQLS